MSKILMKLMHYVKMPVVKYGVPAAGGALCLLTLGLLHPVTLGVIAVGVVGNVMLYKKGF